MSNVSPRERSLDGPHRDVAVFSCVGMLLLMYYLGCQLTASLQIQGNEASVRGANDSQHATALRIYRDILRRGPAYDSGELPGR